MKKVIAVAILLSLMPWRVGSVGGVGSFSNDAAADVVCVERVKFIERLKSNYGERPVSRGINFNGVLVEVFTSQEGHFTILATWPDGVSCLIASGENWQDAPLLKAEIGI